MARTRGNGLELCPEYQEYRAGFQGSGKRWPYDQPFERNDNGETLIPQGEVFCRMPALVSAKGLCSHVTSINLLSVNLANVSSGHCPTASKPQGTRPRRTPRNQAPGGEAWCLLLA
ncbi:uncharacterized protein B0J16DRAFT_331599 [Fusarium flagelliforme]|uniref:uncharacterized protein n=1 Tax=Fusarium flagelliforme TaxID=2675880 RepID=UPI001E8CDD32|nr:uncharacterized protein B0J16DRAFT_331599 [Fusarium flagelliforme]KAH7199124.1 hypothetical protein B0J16DRAFT_331599 [Fusarium flagelliforme]